VGWSDITTTAYKEVSWSRVEFSEFNSSTYSEVNWSRVEFSEFKWSSSTYTSSLNWGSVGWDEITTTGYRQIDYSAVQYSEFNSSTYKEVNWSRVQFSEFESSSYSEVNWSRVQYSEFNWSSSTYTSSLDWGGVQWNEITTASSYQSIQWEYVEFSEMSNGDLRSVRQSLSQESFQSVRVEVGLNSRDNLAGDQYGNELFGLEGNDTLDGEAGNDTLYGCYTEEGGGRGEIDTLIGGGGNDTFVVGTEDEVLYDDGQGRKASAGLKDYAIIKDFTRGKDKIQVHGSRSDYFMGSNPVSGLQGQGLFHDSNDNGRMDKTDELIAVVQGDKLTQSGLKTALVSA
jgi:hypothetical protein